MSAKKLRFKNSLEILTSVAGQITAEKSPITTLKPAFLVAKKGDPSRSDAVPGAVLTFLGSFQHLDI